MSVEVALKLALQYQAAARAAERDSGSSRCAVATTATRSRAMSVCDPVDGMHSAFPGVLARQVFAPRPPAARLVVGATGEERWETDQSALERGRRGARRWQPTRDELAAVVVEPVLQGAGGMHVYHPDCLRVLREVADEHGLLLVVDEIATGFGRTGRLFASEWADVAPDVMCVGKALTGGYLTLAAVLMHRARSVTAITASAFRALLHGPTFMANPLACAVANASLELVESTLEGPRPPRRDGCSPSTSRPRAACPASPTCAPSAPSASCSSTHPSTSPA